ncbi:MAG: thioredoxin domain-containing protein [Gemmatimonadetes bacterium]|nr:thioredoxin domain-containing protein [Gemmatimonadota bacterium]NIO31268.1 thioredoxin domain-containing protein [Gemmatimonadota bacterium]
MKTNTIVLLAALLLPGLLRAQDSADYRVLGSPDAPVELAIYSDFECPYCRNFALAALPAITAEFVDRELVRLRYIYFPLAAIHRNAVSSAKAAHCAGVAGRFWAYHDYLYVRQPEWSGAAAPDSLWIDYAESLGLEPQEFTSCLSAPETLAVVESDVREALDSGATGTPTIVLGNRSLVGLASYEELRAEILAAIEDAQR